MKSNPLCCVLLICGLTVATVPLAMSCSGTRGQHAPRVSPADADSLYAQLEQEFALGDFDAAEATARRLLSGDPGFERAEDVHMIAARASVAAQNYVQAAKHALVVVEDYPLSPYREEALFIAADSYRELGKYYESADLLLGLLTSPVDPEMEGRALNALKILSHE